MFLALGPLRKALVYGVTTWSYLVSITTYFGPVTVSPPAKRLFWKDEPAICSCRPGTPAPHSSELVKPRRLRFAPRVTIPLNVVPWLLGASPTNVPTFEAPPRNFM